jgi:hypothetical protein
MVSPISTRMPSVNAQPHRVRDAVEPSPLPGKSSQNVGHMAKAAIAESGLADLPNNIQGQVASFIARGLDYSSLLAPPPPPPSDDEPAAVDEVAAPSEPAPPAAGEAETPPIEDMPQTGDAIVDPENPESLPSARTDAELALALLQANDSGPDAPTA